jgi:hypothetical protein
MLTFSSLIIKNVTTAVNSAASTKTESTKNSLFGPTAATANLAKERFHALRVHHHLS